MLFTNISKILAEENVFSYSEFAALNPAELVEIVLFGYPKLSKSSSLRLFDYNFFSTCTCAPPL